MVVGTGLVLAIAIWSGLTEEPRGDWAERIPSVLLYVVLVLAVTSTFVAMVRAMRLPRQRGTWPDDEWMDDE